MESNRISFAEASLRHVAREDYANDEAWTLVNLARGIHEIVHPVSGYGSDELGEMCELAFLVRADPRPRASRAPPSHRIQSRLAHPRGATAARPRPAPSEEDLPVELSMPVEATSYSPALLYALLPLETEAPRRVPIGGLALGLRAGPPRRVFLAFGSLTLRGARLRARYGSGSQLGTGAAGQQGGTVPREVVEIGDKLHIMTRRLFEEDLRRHFVGEVVAVSVSLAEIRGYTFIFHSGTNEYRRLPGERTRIFSLGESGHVVNKIPKSIDVGSIVYQTVENRLVISDGRSFSLPINEFGPAR